MKSDNKSLLERVDSLSREVDDLKHDLKQFKQRQQDAESVIRQWEVASKTIEGLFLSYALDTLLTRSHSLWTPPIK